MSRLIFPRWCALRSEPSPCPGWNRSSARAKLPGLARLLFPAAEKVGEAMMRSDAQMRSTIAALAAERYRLADGRWPESLAGLVPKYLSEVPKDPYDGAPLRLRRLGDGVVV